MTEPAENTESKNSDSGKDELPQWARDQITEANNQAAKYRTEKNEAIEAAKSEVTKSFESKIEELEAKIQESAATGDTARHEVDRLKVTIQSGISADKALSFADLLKGENEDELRSHADELKKLFTTEEAGGKTPPATDPSQGNHGQTKPLNGDPLLDAVTSIVNRR